MDNDEKLYSESELVQVLNGLALVHWQKPWYLRIFHKPWINALETALFVLAGDTIQHQHEGQDAVQWAENYLNEED